MRYLSSNKTSVKIANSKPIDTSELRVHLQAFARNSHFLDVNEEFGKQSYNTKVLLCSTCHDNYTECVEYKIRNKSG